MLQPLGRVSKDLGIPCFPTLATFTNSLRVLTNYLGHPRKQCLRMDRTSSCCTNEKLYFVEEASEMRFPSVTPIGNTHALGHGIVLKLRML